MTITGVPGPGTLRTPRGSRLGIADLPGSARQPVSRNRARTTVPGSGGGGVRARVAVWVAHPRAGAADLGPRGRATAARGTPDEALAAAPAAQRPRLEPQSEQAVP